MNSVWLMRLSQLARKRPSRNRVLLIGSVVALITVVWGLETLGLWPDWATAERVPRVPRP